MNGETDDHWIDSHPLNTIHAECGGGGGGGLEKTREDRRTFEPKEIIKWFKKLNLKII